MCAGSVRRDGTGDPDPRKGLRQLADGMESRRYEGLRQLAGGMESRRYEGLRQLAGGIVRHAVTDLHGRMVLRGPVGWVSETTPVG